MKKRNIFYICIAVIVALACIWAFIAASIITHNFKKDMFSQKLTTQKIDIKDLIVIETKDDKKHWELYAEKGQYNSFEKKAVLYNVIGNFFKDDTVTASFQSSQASFKEDEKVIQLEQNSIIVYKDGTNIHADFFEWQGTNKNIIAKGNVKIVKPNEATVYGDEAYVSNQMTDFKIKGKTKTELYGEGQELK